LVNEREERRWDVSLVVLLLIAAAIYLTSIISPPSLMDDVDAVQAQIARNMITSGDWVTARIDGVVYFEKSPLVYWLIAASYRIFGVHDWAARIPIALSAIGLAWLTALFGRWAFGRRAGFYCGLVMATCIGLWLFTRILIPDVMLTLTIALAMWGFLRALDEEEKNPRAWAWVMWASLALGLLLKSLVGIVFPVAAGLLYLLATGELLKWKSWRRLHIFSGVVLLLLIAAPWHVLAMVRNPPWFCWTLKSEPGHYHGFLWFYFINEQLLRFLNLRYPRDYNTVPRVWFWLFHLIWLFPWSVYLGAVSRLSYKPVDRAGRTRLLALLWTGFVLVFFTFSTTQEYYSMPCYPALALLLGSAMAAGGSWVRGGTRLLSVIAGVAGLAAVGILVAVGQVPTPGDISAALSSHPKVYSLSMGHMMDLTLDSFAYLRAPLAIAAAAFLLGALGTMRAWWGGRKVSAAGESAVSAGAMRGRDAGTFMAAAVMMVVFFFGARLAMVRFDPLLSSREMAERILASEPGQVIVDHHYYTFSSIAFYTGRPELLLNGRWNNFEYGSNRPGVPDVFIDDAKLKALWTGPGRYYLVAKAGELPRLESLLGAGLVMMEASGGKVLVRNGAGAGLENGARGGGEGGR
jgi:4-amino-4-deoxy-L-arabinose transferase-like glycosyltransferase